jgi:hypothetical protein
MDAQAGSSGGGIGFVSVILILLAAVAMYYVYTSILGTASTVSTRLVSSQKAADQIAAADSLPTIPAPYEGGEYSVNLWIYVSSFNKNRNARKHIFELKGTYFSTLLIALGAFKNTLVVRTHSGEPGTAGTDATGARGSTAPANASEAGRTDATLSIADVNRMFTPLAMEDSLMETPPVCDLPEVDLQRWVMVTVVLSGRTIDVYIDGKLTRSCVTNSYYKVDPTGVQPVLSDRGGFDGYVSGVAVSNYGYTPDEIYRMYLQGPEGSSTWNIFKWVGSLFSGSTS